MQHNTKAAPTCPVCGDALGNTVLRHGEAKVCGSLECAAVAERAAGLPTETARLFLRQQGRTITGNRASRTERGRRAAEQLRTESSERDRISEQVWQATGEDSVRLVTIPSGSTNLATSDKDRVAEYTEHLRATIAAAFAQSTEAGSAGDTQKARLDRVEALFEREPTLPILSDMLCGMCRGSCCMAGKNTGYVAVSTIRRVMAANPDADEEGILATYLTYLPDQSIAGSCINHGATGCTLPRDIRSDTCNGYYCDELREWQEMPPASRPMNLAVIQREKPHFTSKCSGGPNSVVQVAFVTENGVDADVVDRHVGAAPVTGNTETNR